MKNDQELYGLKELALEYCRQRGLHVNQNIQHLGLDSQIQMTIQNGDSQENIGVLIKDWKRAVGVDIVIRAEQIMKATRLISKILVVSNFFSDPARSLADKIGIFLLTRKDLLRILTSEMKSKSVEESVKNRQNVMLY